MFKFENIIQRFKSLSLPNRFKNSKIFIFVAAFAVIGTILLFATKAAAPFASIDLGSGSSIAPPASIVSGDNTTSGSSYVQFGGGTVNPPTQCSSGGAYLWSSLEACGWPGPTNTGYPSGQTFTNTTSRSITANGTTIDGEKITGNSGDAVLEIYATGVIIRNSWLIRSSGTGDGGTAVIKVYPGASVTIERSTLDGGNRTHGCIWHEGSNMTAKFNNCFGMNDGIFMWESNDGVDNGQGDNFTVTDNYLHDFTEQAANGHIDGLQTEGAKNGLIEHNTFKVSKRAGDPSVEGGGVNSAISIWNGHKTSNNIAVKNNLIAGGGFSIYAQDYHPSELSPNGGFSVTNVQYTNNKFSTFLEGNCVGGYGVWFFRSSWTYQGGPTGNWGANGNTRSGNVILETGFNLDNGNPPGCS
jgi:hypothetical protein